MDVNSNRTNNPLSKPKHMPRLKKEMLEHRLRHNPFSSPPSSTGSHDTVSTTTEELTRNLSNFSFSPDGEGTRRFSDEFHNPPTKRSSRTGRFGAQPTSVLNTSAIARTFPEWSGLLSKDTATFSQNVDFAHAFKAPIPSIEVSGKENVPPFEPAVENTFENVLDVKRNRARADMQARVDDESDASTVLSRTTSRPVMGARRTRFSSAPAEMPSSPPPGKQSLQDMVSKIRIEKQATQVHTVHTAHTYPHNMTPKQSPPRKDLLQLPSHTADKTGISPTGRSFFLPGFRHLPDWTAGTLKFSAMKNGVPVFTRMGVRLDASTNEHGSVNAVGITEEDEEIFVSMDKLQEEVRELHDHDAMLQREAEKLQREVNSLQAELKRFKSRRPSDSALGSDSDGSFNRRNDAHNQDLEAEIAQLRDRLDQASRQVGVNDIHSTALTAERDEALHQASVARERAMHLQTELEATQKDLESTLQERHEKETLELENASLVAANESLEQQYNNVVRENKTLTAQCEKLRRDLASSQRELTSTRDELATTHKQYDALLEEKKLVAQDHASLERNNDTYFKDNKKLVAQVAARDQHIADLKKGIATRDDMIDKMGGLTTDTAIIELNADLQSEVERLETQLEEQAKSLQAKADSISAKEGRIRVLKEQNLELSSENQKLQEENRRLREEAERMEGQWIDNRHKVIRLNQQITKNNTEYLKALNDNTEDCVRLEEDFKQKEAVLLQKLERRAAAVKKVKALTTKITEIAQQELTGKTTTKITRIVEPTGSRYAEDNVTGRSTAMNIEDDPTTELHLTQGSDFVSIMDEEIVKLKQTYRDMHEQQQEAAQSAAAGNTIEVTEYDLPVLPGIRRSVSDASTRMSKAMTTAQLKQPVGILKKSTQFPIDEDTGRFSVKSALSIASHHTEDDSIHTVATMRSQRSAKSIPNEEEKGPRPESRLRRNSDTGRVGRDPTMTEHNMTSAFFMPDITIHTEKEATNHSIPALSKEARRVLDGICKHKSGNCNVCIRIAAFGESRSVSMTRRVSITTEDMRKGKKTISVEKPIPVSERMPEVGSKYAEEPTMRPSMDPGEALAILIKETRDEIEHLQMELKRLNDVYFALDKSLGQRERRRIMAEIKKLQSEVEMKSGHLYKLHDVLEGQKQAGQLMTEEEADVTILSGLVRMEATVESKDGSSWNGFD
ncbi:protein Daple [Podospora aff. communis PSN243]|uniref:Protein Daple n=1 Tax=Podospora aff. communis PSN243 TaxID=3040156 RepID=A0AAV9GM50_9PEZI|nr:protein Daple [Podospora aff. communis PSN243]